jgi:MoaA/NifB/PqqE/SkfB family radical SAM enzyme
MLQQKSLQRKAVLPKGLMIKRYLRRLHSYMSHTTPTKLFNLLSMGFEMVLRREVVRCYPFIAQIEPTNVCQLQCPSCPTGQGINPDPTGNMQLDSFIKIIDELKDYLYEVLLYGFGEPMLLKDIFTMIGCAAENNIRTVISTNLCHLPAEDVDRLINSGLEMLVVSLDGMSQETYQKYRVKGDVAKVKRNVEAVVARKRKLNRRNPIIQLQFIVMDHNRHEIQQAIEYSRRIGVEEFILKEVGPRYIPRFGDKGQEEEQARKLQAELNICPKLWYETYIGWNGLVRPCCLTFDGGLGNIKTESFANIWNNKQYTASRRIFNLTTEKTPGFHVPCLGCHLLSEWMDPVHLP